MLDCLDLPKKGVLVANVTNKSTPASDRPAKAQPASGADIVVQSLVNHGVDTIFAYPGGASIPLHQALTRFRDKVRVILPRHEQGGGFAAQGYARSTGKIGVCMATSGPGAHKPRHRHRRRQAGRHSALGDYRPGGHAGHRHRRLSRDADRRGLAAA